MSTSCVAEDRSKYGLTDGHLRVLKSDNIEGFGTMESVMKKTDNLYFGKKVKVYDSRVDKRTGAKVKGELMFSGIIVDVLPFYVVVEVDTEKHGRFQRSINKVDIFCKDVFVE